MPDRPADEINKAALNALVDLYYLYSDMVVEVCNESSESTEEIELFFTAPDGLRDLIKKYFAEASLDPVVAGGEAGELTLQLMMPRERSIVAMRVRDDLRDQIITVTGELKGYNREAGGVGVDTPQEVKDVVNAGRRLLAKRKQHNGSVAGVAIVDLTSAEIGYEDHNLIIGTEKIDLESESLMDMVTRYMVLEKRKGEQVYTATISTWIESESNGQLGEPSNRAVKDACRGVNLAVQQKLDVEEDFFDTSIRHRVIRRY